MLIYTVNSTQYNQAELLQWATNILDKDGDRWRMDIASFIVAWFDDNPWVSLQTSGTTGTSKTITVRKSAMTASAQLTNDFFQLKKGASALLCLPARYIGGKMMIVRALISGMNLIITKPSATPLEGIEEKIDFCAMIPLQVAASLKHDTEKFKQINTLIIGGAPIPIALESELAMMKQSIYATFGMTETLSHVALKCLSGEHATSYYQALDGVTFAINNTEQHQDCLIIEAPHISSKPLITNDVITLIDSHRFIWKGRNDLVINSGGIKIIVEELEKTIHSLILRPDFFIASLPHDSLGQSLILLLEGDKSELDKDLLLSKLKTQLPKYHNPKEIYFLKEFIRTETGKIQRNASLALLKLW